MVVIDSLELLVMSGRKIEEFIRDSARILKYATKPSRRELYMMTLIVVLGLMALGFLGFVVRAMIQAIIGG